MNTSARKFILIGILVTLELVSALTAADTNQATRETRPSVQLAWRGPPEFFSVDIRSPLLPAEMPVHYFLESCILAIPADNTNGGHSKRPIKPYYCRSMFCTPHTVVTNRTQDGVEFVLDGNFSNLSEMPFRFKIGFLPQPHRVRSKCEVLSMPPGVKLLALIPCLRHAPFSDQNHPHFDMARKSFMLL